MRTKPAHVAESTRFTVARGILAALLIALLALLPAVCGGNFWPKWSAVENSANASMAALQARP